MGALKVKVCQSDERLKYAEDQNFEKDKELAFLRTEKSEAVRLMNVRTQEVASLRSAEYKECIIADFQKTERYKSEIEIEPSLSSIRGLYMLSANCTILFLIKKLLVEVYNNSFEAEVCRRGADFVPLLREELDALQASDSNKGLLEWVPHAPAHPPFRELLEAALNDTDPEEVAVTKLPDESGPSSSAPA